MQSVLLYVLVYHTRYRQYIHALVDADAEGRDGASHAEKTIVHDDAFFRFLTFVD